MLIGGRLDLGVGVGWQREEYLACGVPFEARFSRLDEQMRACRLLWTQAPATFTSASVNFTRTYSRPFPVQARLPVLLGVGATPKNIGRIAEYGDGWLPLRETPAQVREGVAQLRAAFTAAGRDPQQLQVRVVFRSLTTLTDLPAYSPLYCSIRLSEPQPESNTDFDIRVFTSF